MTEGQLPSTAARQQMSLDDDVDDADDYDDDQGCIFRLTCSHPELTEDHVLTNAHVKVFRTVTRNAINKSV